MNASDIRLADFTGRARIRHAALHLFAAEGYAQTSLRSIAQTAGVSLALIAHHFGSKHQLRDAIDSWVLGTFEKLAHATSGLGDGRSDEPYRAFADAVRDLLDDEPDVRAYLRRMIVVDASPNGAALLASLLTVTRCVVARSPRSDVEQDLEKCAVKWTLLLLGPALLEPALMRCVPGLFSRTGAGPFDGIAPSPPRAGRAAAVADGARPNYGAVLQAERFHH